VLLDVPLRTNYPASQIRGTSVRGLLWIRSLCDPAPFVPSYLARLTEADGSALMAEALPLGTRPSDFLDAGFACGH
jgi:hypothetical protein